MHRAPAPADSCAARPARRPGAGGAAHRMLDRGLLSLSADLDGLISHHANDPKGVRACINLCGCAIAQQAFECPQPTSSAGIGSTASGVPDFRSGLARHRRDRSPGRARPIRCLPTNRGPPSRWRRCPRTPPDGRRKVADHSGATTPGGRGSPRRGSGSVGTAPRRSDCPGPAQRQSVSVHLADTSDELSMPICRAYMPIDRDIIGPITADHGGALSAHKLVERSRFS